MPVSRDLDTKPVALPTDLHFGDSETVAWLGKINQCCGRVAIFAQKRQIPVAGDLRRPQLEASNAATHGHHRDENIRRIAARHFNLYHRVGARKLSDIARQDTFALYRHQCRGLTERHADLELRNLSCLIAFGLRDDVHPVPIVATEPPFILASQPDSLNSARNIAIGIHRRCNNRNFARDARIQGAACKTQFVRRG